MRRINADIFLGGATLIVSLILFQQTFLIRNLLGTRFGAELWPRFVIAIIAMLAIIQLFLAVRGKAAPSVPVGDEVSDQVEGGFTSRDRIALAVFICFGTFVYLLPILGTPLAGFLLVFGLLSLIGEPTPRAIMRHVLIALGSVGLMWVVFTYLLRVILPAGRWATWFQQL